MRTFHWVSGELTEVQRFINVPMRWCEQYPARERRELWIRTDAGSELKFVVHTRYLPARRGHRVAVLVGSGEAVALLKLCSDDFSSLEVHALFEGDRVDAWETVLLVEGDYASFAHLETLVLGTLTRRTRVCTNVLREGG